MVLMKNSILLFIYFILLSSLTIAQPVFQWAGGYISTSDGSGNAVAVDGGGNVYTIGYFNGTTDFDPGPGSVNLTSHNFKDIFISKMSSGGSLIWVKQFGGMVDE